MRNVFVSYAHRLDQNEVDDFRTKFGQDKMVFSDRSLENMDIGNLSDDTIKNNYIKPKIKNSVNVNIKMLKSSNMKMHKYLIVNV